MTVVARHRAEEGDARLTHPGPLAADRALQQAVGDGVVHQREAGVVADHHLRRHRAEERREQRAQFRQALEHAVIAGVGPVGREEIVFTGQPEQRAGQIQLLARRLAAREIEGEPTLAERVVATLDVLVDRAEVGGRERLELRHRPETVPRKGPHRPDMTHRHGAHVQTG